MATHFSLKVRGLYLKRPASRSLDGATASAAAGGHLPNEVVELGVADFAVDLLPLLAQGVEHLAASQGDAVAPRGPAFEGCEDVCGWRHLAAVFVIAAAHLLQKLLPQIGWVHAVPGALPKQLRGPRRHADVGFRRHRLCAYVCGRAKAPFPIVPGNWLGNCGPAPQMAGQLWACPTNGWATVDLPHKWLLWAY